MLFGCVYVCTLATAMQQIIVHALWLLSSATTNEVIVFLFSFLIFITTTCGQTIISNPGSMSLKSPGENNTKQLKEINRKQEMIAQNSHGWMNVFLFCCVECVFYYPAIILCFSIYLFGLNCWEQVSSGLKAWEQNCHRKMCFSSHPSSFNLENVFCFAASKEQ